MRLVLALGIALFACSSKPNDRDECAALQATIARLATCPALASETANASKQLADLARLIATNGGDRAPPELLESIRETCRSQNASLQALTCSK